MALPINPFVDIRVTPTYGSFSTRVVWKLAPGFDGSKFIIFRSPDGMNWLEIGASSLSYFIDTDAVTGGKIYEFYYKVICQHEGKHYDSPEITTFGTIDKSEFATARYIMRQEYLIMQKMSRILLFKARRETICPKCVDPQTGQKVGTTLCEVCYGTGFDGGYWPPVTTFMRILSINPKTVDHSQEGAGVVDVNRIKAKLLDFPCPVFEDLIVDSESDERYLVEVADEEWLKCKVPMFAVVTMLVLRRNDVRYTIPLTV